MITELRITDLGVIAEATLDPAPGFTAVTGETGAGKTMVVTGLSLLLGQRADRSLVRRDGTDTARTTRVEGRFHHLDAQVRQEAHQCGAAFDGEGEEAELLLARTLSSAGRSRAYIGGAQAPIATLGEISDQLITIHGQSGQIRLAHPDTQRDMLDRFGAADLAEVAQAYRQTWQSWRAARAELDRLRTESRERARQVDALRAALDEIAAVDPQPGEDVELRAEVKRLEAADDLRVGAGRAAVAINGDEVDFDTSPGATALLSAAREALELVAHDDPDAADLAARTRDVSYAVAEIGADIASYLAGLEGEPGRLEHITGRLAALGELTRKYANSPAEVLAWAETARTELDNLVGDDDRVDLLADQVDQLREKLERLGADLSAARAGAAARLEEEVASELTSLAMPHARITVALTPTELGPHGGESVEFLFAANRGSTPGPLGKVASGGELSRVRLALEVTVGDRPGQTLVFDEVDSGVGGAVAVEIGRRLKRLAAHCQVIVVTHLAQVAAFADRHFVVVKADDGPVTTSGVREVADEDRAGELARMMAGLDTTSTALAHAEELLDVARRA